MPLEVVRVEPDRAQLAAGIKIGLVVEVRRGGVAAFAAGGDCPGVELRAELDDRDEAVAAGAVIFPGVRPGLGPERGERTPLRRGEGHRGARLAVVEMGVD